MDFKTHIATSKFVSIVTSRSSGSSYLNRVKLQNGCLSLGHANLFIPSTLAGMPIDPEMGCLDEEILSRNHDLAIDIYIDRVNKCPCGNGHIELFKGPNSQDQIENTVYVKYFKVLYFRFFMFASFNFREF